MGALLNSFLECIIMSCLIDVIVPVYNRAHNISNLIAVLEHQTFRDFRAIFVDDGSTDGSSDVLNKLLPKASFEYVVIQKENGGAGSARNAGLRAVTADWISFVDSDDGLQPQFLEYFYAAVIQTECELAICDLQEIPVGSEKKPNSLGELKCRKISASEGMKIFCTRWIGPYCLFMSRSFQQESKLFFDEECTYCEDAPFITNVIASAKRIALIEQELYLYYTHQGSLSRSPRLDKFCSAIKSFSKVENRLLKEKTDVARVFNEMGGVRYYIATLRRGAVQMDYESFIVLAKMVDIKRYRKNIHFLQQRSQRFACYLALVSKTLFYCTVRFLFKD